MMLLILLSLAAASSQASPGAQHARTIQIQVNDSMRFVPDRIEAHPGERLHVVLKDIGTFPKTAMAHNFVLLKRGTNAKFLVNSCASARDTDYVAPAVKDAIIAYTPLVGPGETVDVTFNAPQRGNYTFICTFPGHYAMGMSGTLVVK
jgi:azurin